MVGEMVLVGLATKSRALAVIFVILAFYGIPALFAIFGHAFG